MNHHPLSLPTEPAFSSSGERTAEQLGRIRSTVTLDIEVEGSITNAPAVLHDLSSSGASFRVRVPVAVPDAMIVLRIPSPEGTIEILARVERVDPVADAGQFVVARFAQVDPDADDELATLISCLVAASQTSPRQGTLAPRRLKLKVGPGPRGGAILNEIARGMLCVTLPQPLVHDAWLHIVIPGLSGAEALALAARVVSQRVVWQGGRLAFLVAFSFEQMRATDRVALAALQQIFV